MSAVATEFHNLVVKLEEEGHALASRFRALFDKVTGDVPALEAEAVADVKQVEADAVKAAEPVVAEAEGDAKQLTTEVVADVETAVHPAPAQVPDPTAVTPTA